MTTECASCKQPFSPYFRPMGGGIGVAWCGPCIDAGKHLERTG
jgi:hypothetical protein